MPNKHPLMKLSREEELFLRRWMYDEVHYQDGQGPAKQLQIQHRASPAHLATLIAAAIPDPADQEAAGFGLPPAQSLTWPWTSEELRARLTEARAALAEARLAEARAALVKREKEKILAFSSERSKLEEIERRLAQTEPAQDD
jgi:hypothetical protein